MHRAIIVAVFGGALAALAGCMSHPNVSTASGLNGPSSRVSESLILPASGSRLGPESWAYGRRDAVESPAEPVIDEFAVIRTRDRLRTTSGRVRDDSSTTTWIERVVR